MSEGFHKVGGGRIFWQDDGAGAPVVLLHGFGLDRRMWDDQVASLARRYRVIRYDMRGYGRSSMPGAEAYSHADDLDALLSGLGATPAHVVGLSNGGRTALRFALAYPAATRSLTLVDAALDGHGWSSDWQTLWGAIDRTAKSGDVEGAKRLWLEHPLFAAARSQPAVASRLAAIVGDYSGWHWVNPDPGTAAGGPAITRLAEIRMPTLVVVGQRDLADFHAVAGTLASGIAGAVRVEVPNAGHMVNMEAPAAFNRVLADFLPS